MTASWHLNLYRCFSDVVASSKAWKENNPEGPSCNKLTYTPTRRYPALDLVLGFDILALRLGNPQWSIGFHPFKLVYS